MVKRKGRGGQKKASRVLALEPLNEAQRQNNKRNVISAEPVIVDNQRNASPPPEPAPGLDMQDLGSRPPLQQSRKGRKKKRIDEVVGPETQQNAEEAEPKVPRVKSGPSSKIQLPEKHMLEFVLDILQRRDTHQIFAQPVDPNEVEGYYTVIDHPMDFGTLRAKLQEGKYKTLEEFEKDVFLIPRNAMRFNLATTIYFRQARAINELAKRVFRTLKTEPHKLELEFSLSRRRKGRKPRGETSGYRAKYNVKRGGEQVLHGSIDGVNVKFYDRRQAYKPETSIAAEESIFSAVFGSSRQLVAADVGIANNYKESLLRFAEGLGPVAKKVANQKLKCFAQTQIHSQSQTVRYPSRLISSSDAQQRPRSMDKGKDVLTDLRERAHQSQSTKSGFDLEIPSGFKFMDLLQEAINEEDAHPEPSQPTEEIRVNSVDPSRFSPNTHSHLYSRPSASVNSGAFGVTDACRRYVTGDWMVGWDQVRARAHLAPRSQSGVLEFLSSANARPKSCVHPSRIITPSSSGSGSRSGTGSSCFLGSGEEESNDPLDLNSGATTASADQPLQWNLPTQWSPRPIYNFLRSRQQMDPQVASAAPFMQDQPNGENRREAFRFVPTPGAPQPQPNLLDLLGQDRPKLQVPAIPYVQPLRNEGNPLGREGYLRRGAPLGLSRFTQTGTVGSSDQGAYIAQGPACFLPRFMQNDNMSSPGQSVVLPRETMQFGLPTGCQGVRSTGGSFFDQRLGMQGYQPNSSDQLWSSQQQFVEGVGDPDLAIGLQTQNERYE